jgi:hypothetical protein
MEEISMPKLFAVMLGGRAAGCNTELHDAVFVVGETFEETHPRLVCKWFGLTKRLHIDSVMEVTYADGHEIILRKEKPVANNKLFFVNFGAYKPNYFGEEHEVGFYIGPTKTEALAKAKANLCLSLIEPHCDDNLPVDDIFSLENIDQYYIHLIPSEKSVPLTITSKYFRLDTAEILARAEVLKSVGMQLDVLNQDAQ